MGHDRRGFADLLKRRLERSSRPRLVLRQLIEDVSNEERNVVQRVVQFVGDTRGQFAQARQLGDVHELVAFLAQLPLRLFLRGDIR